MKKKIITTMLMMVGVALIVTGIISTIIQLTNFDVFTFNLGKAIILVFGFSFIGIIFIISSVAMRSNISNNQDQSKPKSLEDIAKEVKVKLSDEQESKKPKKCPYCKTIIAEGKTKCSNCGANLKHKE